MHVWLYEKLAQKNLSQAKLAEMLGISKHTLNRKFSGKAPFLYDEVVRICDILEIDEPRKYFGTKK